MGALSPPNCQSCGATYHKVNAKFCSRCGAQKSSTAANTAPPSVSVGAKKPMSTARSAGKAAAIQLAEKTAPTPFNSDSLGAGSPPAGGDSTMVFKDTKVQKTTSTLKAPRRRSSIQAAAEALPRVPSLLSADKRSAALDHSSDSSSDDEAKGTTAPIPKNGTVKAAVRKSSSGGDAKKSSAASEEEAQYAAWATLPREGLTPEMLQTSNAAELKQWHKGSLIGRGTYGSVYLGLLPDGSFHAVKCVELGNKKVASDQLGILELVSLSREINMMSRLRHKNLCTFKGVYYDPEESAICMFMEYVGGGSLSSLVKRFKPLPPTVVRSWACQLLEGLQCLHEQHIIHRDVKGDNVLVDTTVDPATMSQIKLVDFGAARRLTDAVSQSCTVIGTPYWMAPEVVDVTGEGKGYSYKADVWSVGCTIAEMLTGRPPWPSKTSAPAAIMMIASATGMPTEIPTEEATPGCLDFMKQCFTRDAEKRPTVNDLLKHPWILGTMD